MYMRHRAKPDALPTMEPLSRTWLAFARSCMAMVSLPRSWQDFVMASKELAMDLGKGTMTSNTGRDGKPKAIRQAGISCMAALLFQKIYQPCYHAMHNCGVAAETMKHY